MQKSPAIATRLRGVWMSVKDFPRSREFYERLGAHYDSLEPVDGIAHATLGGIRLIFETGHGAPPHTGQFLLFDVTDADGLHAELVHAGCEVEGPPTNEPWGRQFHVQDPDGHSIAFIGPVRS
jgi:predicted enzyme related to lactoylglutathione lyase